MSLLVFAGSPVHAETFNVTNLNDSGPGSLRQAIVDADNKPGADTIVFDPSLSGILPILGTLEISTVVDIIGPGADILTIIGNGRDRNVFYIRAGAEVTLSGLSITNGANGIANRGTLTVSECDIFQHYGSGIHNAGNANLTVNDSNLYENNDDGIGNDSSTLTVNGTTLSDNLKQGIQNYRGTVTLVDSLLSGNKDRGFYSSYGSSFTIDRTTFLENSTTSSYGGGAMRSDDAVTLTITNSTFSANEARSGCGGGITIADSSNVTFYNNTLSGNAASTGGGLCVAGSTLVNLFDSTITDNFATSKGGGIYIYSSITTLLMGNSILAGNTTTGGGIDPDSGIELYNNGTFTSRGYNLLGQNGTRGLVNASAASSDKTLAGTIDTAIGPLADNGGPTETHIVVAGSPAINGGSNDLIPRGVTTDQRGEERIQRDTVDIGAVEVGLEPSVNFSLSVSKAGNGSVTSQPAGIDCGSDCSESYTSGSAVTLTASPASGASFAGWGGACSGSAATCRLTMQADKTVLANFSGTTLGYLPLAITLVGEGQIDSTPTGLSCADWICRGQFLAGTELDLTAAPRDGWRFVGWEGACNHSRNTCSLTLDEAQAAAAIFEEIVQAGEQPLEVRIVGDGQVSSEPDGIACGSDCEATYPEGTTVTLTAKPDAGVSFVGWGGACSDTTSTSCRVDMTEARQAIAAFGGFKVDRETTAWKVAEIYMATLGYAPDNDGLQYWITNIDTLPQWTPETVAQSFFDQPLVQQEYPEDEGYERFIDELYRNIFGRGADSQGFDYWLGELDQGHVERNQMIIALINGGWENPSPDAQSDMLRFKNRIEVSLAFAAYQAENGIAYGDLSTTDQAYLRQVGRDILLNVTVSEASRDKAIESIASLLAPLH